MPIREYVCKNCDLELELLVKLDEQPVCEKCNDLLQQILSPTKGYVKGSKTPVKQ